jgi:hypothetical protein
MVEAKVALLARMRHLGAQALTEDVIHPPGEKKIQDHFSLFMLAAVRNVEVESVTGNKSTPAARFIFALSVQTSSAALKIPSPVQMWVTSTSLPLITSVIGTKHRTGSHATGSSFLSLAVSVRKKRVGIDPTSIADNEHTIEYRQKQNDLAQELSPVIPFHRL